MTNDSGSDGQSLDQARLLDRGAQAEIYEWGDGRVLRLIPQGDGAAEMLAREASVMSAAAAAGVPVPAVHELVTIEGRPGLVMDRVDGGPMLSTMLGRPWRLLPLVGRFGMIQAEIHALDAPDEIDNVQDWSRRQLAKLAVADGDLGSRAEEELERLPTGRSLLHGDYHPLNLLMAESGEPQVIDWPAAAAGPPEADVARTLVLIEAAEPPNGSPIMLKLLGAFRTRLFIPRYLRAYERVRPLDRALVERWRLVRAIERLAEAPPGEERALREMIQRAAASEVR